MNVVGGGDESKIDHLFGVDGFIKSLWPNQQTHNDPVSILLSLLPKIYRQPGLGKASLTGRHDILVTEWSPRLTEWYGDILVKLNSETCPDCTQTLSSLYAEPSVVRSPCGALYFYGRGRLDAPLEDKTPIAPMELVVRSASDAAADIISALQKKYGEPSSTSLDYLLSSLPVIKSSGEEGP